MQLLVITILLSVLGLLTSLVLVGIFPSIISFCLSVYCYFQEKSINTVRALCVSFAGILLPIIMYINCYGFSLPFDKGTGMPFWKQIIYENYSNLGFDMSFLQGEKDEAVDAEYVETVKNEKEDPVEENENLYYSGDEAVTDSSEDVAETVESTVEASDDKKNSIDYMDYPESIFEKFEDIEKDFDIKPESGYVGASDDDMPSYGGLPVGTEIVAQYFREDDHNCNPVIVLQNKTGEIYRYECMFTARDGDGNELAVSERTSEVVPNGAKFVIEGRFDKNLLNGQIPAMYEFTMTKRTPYEKDMSDQVLVYTKVDGNSVVLAADNTSDIKVKVDAYVLFFYGDELVDCIWLIPNNIDDVCINPGSLATIKGDAYYKFDRIETYYTAYEAIEVD
ncbi:hypothetical protein SAMN04487928_12634 [Butyrivibrio proteoclasticus]|uniref:Uncharacterized protein n=1 Tax=Butyrivibrio proteoclasticus TaxID=43305 RepID=A0A1I5WY99_9FIRM|nr:hypothetical protein [Butyrivibrio proteoclasticus]SFQ24618.1 hypothetical protein SAMN04487928_12634 [Butyrivibrio proteoclasticus]